MLEAGIAQQPLRPGDGAVDAMAVFRHHVRRQRIEEQRDIGGILGQRRHGVGVVGEGDQRDLPAGAFAQQGRDLGAGLREPRGRQVARQHRARQVDCDHQRRLALPQGMFGLAEARAGHREQGQRRRQQAEPACPLPVLRATSCIEQVRQQVRVHRVLPHAAVFRLRAPPPCEQGQGQQAEQPPRAQEMQLREIGERSVHARLRASSASRPSSSAPASGNG